MAGIDPTAFASGTTGQNPFGSLDSASPSELLNPPQGAGNVAKVGEEDVRGVPTTRYRADIEVARAGRSRG